MTIGKAIRFVRKLRGMSQAELAKDAGITSNALNIIEKKGSRPHKSTMAKICGVLEIPEYYLHILAIGIPKDACTEVAESYDSLKSQVVGKIVTGILQGQQQ